MYENCENIFLFTCLDYVLNFILFFSFSFSSSFFVVRVFPTDKLEFMHISKHMKLINQFVKNKNPFEMAINNKKQRTYCKRLKHRTETFKNIQKHSKAVWRILDPVYGIPYMLSVSICLKQLASELKVIPKRKSKDPRETPKEREREKEELKNHTWEEAKTSFQCIEIRVYLNEQ